MRENTIECIMGMVKIAMKKVANRGFTKVAIR